MTKTLIILIGLLTIATILSILYRQKKKATEKSNNRTSSLSSEDTELQKFKDTAQAKIAYLIEFMSEHDRDVTLFRYFVKSEFSENGIEEHMWTQVYEFRDGFFIGTLANDPIDIKKLKYNDKVEVRKQDVEDWRLHDFLTNTQVGGYSTDYLHKTSE